MQFFLLAPLVVYPLWAWPKIGYALLVAVSALPIASTAVLITSKNLLATPNPFTPDEYVTYSFPYYATLKSVLKCAINFMFLRRNQRYYDWIYKMPWTRCGPYVIGLALGYILHKGRARPEKFANVSKYIVALGWVVSTVLALVIIYGPFPYWDLENVEMATVAWHSRLYGALHRYVWGLVIAWIIFACVTGHGGVVNDFLSWKAFLPLGRL